MVGAHTFLHGFVREIRRPISLQAGHKFLARNMNLHMKRDMQALTYTWIAEDMSGGVLDVHGGETSAALISPKEARGEGTE